PLAHYQPNRVPAVEPRVRQVPLPRRVDLVQQPRVERVDLLVRPVRPPAKAHQPEPYRRHQLERRVLLHPPRELSRQRDMPADDRAEPLHAVTPYHEPELERPEPASQLNAPVAEINDLRVVRGAEEFGR